MTRIVVAAKQDKTLLQDTQSKDVILSQPSIVQVGVTKDDVQSIVKDGNNIIINLKNGEKIVLENFFNPSAETTNSLAFPEKDGSFAVANFDAQGKFTNYSGLTELDGLLYKNATSNAVNQLDAYDSHTSSDFSFENLLSMNTVKAGLGILSAVGLGLWLLDDNGSTSTPANPDIVAPVTPTAVLNADAVSITGTGEAGSTIYVVDANEKVLASTTVDSSGNYSVKLSTALTDGNKVYLNAKDSAGNASKYVAVTGTKDTIAPDEPQAQLSDDGKVVSGKAEANSTINVYDPAGNLVGTAKANANGVFSVQVSPALTGGSVGTVVAVDSTGNKSTAHSIIAGKDTVAPNAPMIEVNKDGSSVKGTAEANAKVEIQDSTGKVIGTGTVDANGKFTVSISPVLASTDTAKIIIEDAAGNKSTPLDIKLGSDTLAPDKAVATLNTDGNLVTGTAEANAKVAVYDSSNNLLGTATVDANGQYSVTLSTSITDSKIGNVYVTDATGNKSDVTNVTGTKDTIAPSKAVVSDVVDAIGAETGSVKTGGATDDSKPTLSGTGEANATLTIYDNAKAIGVVTVPASGKWVYTPDVDLGLGSHSITLIQTDQAGNTSLVSDPYTFTVVEPVATASSVEVASTALSADVVPETVVATSASIPEITATTENLAVPNTASATAIGVNASSLKLATTSLVTNVDNSSDIHQDPIVSTSSVTSPEVVSTSDVTSKSVIQTASVADALALPENSVSPTSINTTVIPTAIDASSVVTDQATSVALPSAITTPEIAVTSASISNEPVTDTTVVTHAVDPTAELISSFANPISSFSLGSILEQSDLNGIDYSAPLGTATNVPSIADLLSDHQLNTASTVDSTINQAIHESAPDTVHTLAQSTEITAQPTTVVTPDADVLTHLISVGQRDDLFDLLNSNHSII